MNEYTIEFLNGLIVHLNATDWKDAIEEGIAHAKRRQWASTEMKYILDEDGAKIKNINLSTLTYECGIQALDVKAVI